MGKNRIIRKMDVVSRNNDYQYPEIGFFILKNSILSGSYSHKANKGYAVINLNAASVLRMSRLCDFIRPVIKELKGYSINFFTRCTI